MSGVDSRWTCVLWVHSHGLVSLGIFHLKWSPEKNWHEILVGKNWGSLFSETNFKPRANLEIPRTANWFFSKLLRTPRSVFMAVPCAQGVQPRPRTPVWKTWLAASPNLVPRFCPLHCLRCEVGRPWERSWLPPSRDLCYLCFPLSVLFAKWKLAWAVDWLHREGSHLSWFMLYGFFNSLRKTTVLLFCDLDSIHQFFIFPHFCSPLLFSHVFASCLPLKWIYFNHSVLIFFFLF